uniref:G-protein coupled receptors family 1 profile domain-containing protein n=1 Tax=Sus scrofa TaxID=9823 RepID=A0A8D1MAS9_PIG
MGMSNVIRLSEFILLGLSFHPEDQKPLFVLFLIMYLVTLMGNLLFILAICSDPQLQNPMYFFLSILSFADICYTTVTVSKMSMNFLSETKTIFYTECLTQLSLAAMTIDHYVAICNPFHYVTVMNHRCCVLLLAAFTAFSYLHSLLHVLLVSRLTFCASNVIHHFFCDVNPVLKLACFCQKSCCHDRRSGICDGPVWLHCHLLPENPHCCPQNPLNFWKTQTFSTCSSHLTVATLLYGSISFVYFQPLSSYSVKDRNSHLHCTDINAEPIYLQFKK